MMEFWDGSTDTTTQQYTFDGDGWPVGGHPSFEDDLSDSNGQGDERERCLRDIRLLKAGEMTDKMEDIKDRAPNLYARIIREPPESILPSPGSGMTPGSLLYVINHPPGTIQPPPIGNPQDTSRYLRWITQIAITIWEYQCNRILFEELHQNTSNFILSMDFTSCRNAAAYLAIISFVLAGDLDEKLSEYVDAVVWRSRFELVHALEPLQSIINRERHDCLEFIFNHFSRVFLELTLSDDQQLCSLGRKLHERLKSETQSQLDFSRASFADVMNLECAVFPARLEETILGALHLEVNQLRTKFPAFRAHNADMNIPTPHEDPGLREGAGSKAIARGIAWVRGGMKGHHRKESMQTPESQAKRIQRIIDDSTILLEKRRRHIADSVQELIRSRDSEIGVASSLNGGEQELYQHENGTENGQWSQGNEPDNEQWN